jgi:hypothetical protein
MKVKIFDKLYCRALVLGFLLFSLLNNPVAAVVMIDDSPNTYSFVDFGWGAFEWMGVAILAPLILAWVLVYVLRRAYKKKGYNVSGSKDLFHTLTIGLMFVVATYSFLFFLLTYATSFKGDDYYIAAILSIILISDIVVCLWIFLYFFRYIVRPRKSNKLLVSIDNEQKNENNTL